MKFTFKKQPRETGLAAVARPDVATEVKLEGKVVGIIEPAHRDDSDGRWRVRLMVEGAAANSPNCPWRWVTFKARFDEEPAARTWLQEKVAAITGEYSLHKSEHPI